MRGRARAPDVRGKEEGMSKIYLVGALKNDNIPKLAASLRSDGHDVFDDWFSAGIHADTIWKDYEQNRGRTYIQALRAPVAEKNFSFDVDNIEASDTVILVLPAGRSAHLELGYAAGLRKDTHILLDCEYDRWDLMYRFSSHVWDDAEAMRAHLINNA
jgi:hypothetical protein